MQRLLGIVLGLCLLGGIIYFMNTPSPTTNTNTHSGDVSMQANYAGGVYADYTGPESIPEEGDTVLFFHADRCPTCNQAQKDFQAGLPEGLTVLKVDYDKEEELKQQYQILTQTSYVYVEPDGTQIKRRVGGTTVEDVLEQLADAKSGEPKPREKVQLEKAAEAQKEKEGEMVEQEESVSGNKEEQAMVDTSAELVSLAKAYFAGGCFWCLDGPFDATPGVQEALVGYIGGSADAATYKAVAGGKTQHRESVEVTYDPRVVSYKNLVATYFRQIDPTDDGGQFADRGFHYTTAIYYVNDEQKTIAEAYIKSLEGSGKFDEPIVVKVLPFPTFYKAEEEHQNYYLKNTTRYERYKQGSGRAGYIKDVWSDITGLFEEKESDKEIVKPDLSHLTDLQYRVTQEKGTERPFDNEYRDNKAPGIYVDIIDGTPLFSSTDKFDSRTGRPSFTKPISLEKVNDQLDISHGMIRTEVTSSTSAAHLGHIFNDGPKETGGQRYCINSAALKFIPLEDMEEMGYGEWLVLFE